MYVPFLKTKQGELRALAQLSNDVAQHVLPLLDVHRPNEISTKTLQPFLMKVCDGIQRHWEGRPAIVDVFDLPPDIRADSGEHALDVVYTRLSHHGFSFVPCTGLDRDDAYNAIVRRYVADRGQFAIRLQREDLEAPVLSVPGLHALLEDMGTNAASTYLLVDLRELVGNPLVIADECVMFLDEAVEQGPWADIVVAGSSMPRSVSESVGVGQSGYVSRTELEVWAAVCDQCSYNVTFGDYGIVNPEYIDLDPRLISGQRTPAIRYALVDQWYIARGARLQKHGYAQYYDLAADIVRSCHFDGAAYSSGDSRIAHSAAKQGTTGNAATWVTAGQNHHITQTVRELS